MAWKRLNIVKYILIKFWLPIPDIGYKGHVVYILQEYSWRSTMNLSNPLTSTFRIRPGTLLHDDKREKYFYDMILPLILVHQIWGIGVCTLAPGGPEKHSQWGHQRAFSAGSTMDRSNSWLIGISSEIISCGTPRITAIHEVCPWEPAQSVAECRRRASCSRASKTAASALFCLCWPSLLMFCGMRLFMLLCIIGLALLTYFYLL